jgi:hypothetical protein
MEDETEQKPRLVLILGLAFLFMVGVLIEVISSIYYGGWWLIFVVLFFGFIPLPNHFCKQIGGDPMATGENRFNHGVV